MNRFNQILINAVPPSDHGSKLRDIYLPRGRVHRLTIPSRYISFTRYFPFSLNLEADFASNLRNPYRTLTLSLSSFLSPSLILSKSLNPSSSLAFEVSSERRTSSLRVPKGTRITRQLFRSDIILSNAGHKESNGRNLLPPSKCIYRKHVSRMDGSRAEIRDASNENRGFSRGGRR